MNVKEQNLTADRIRKQIASYPEMQIKDLFKFLYQSAFGCEHMISSPDKVKERIVSEFESIKTRDTDLVIPLDGDYSRVSLSWLDKRMSADTLGEIFTLSAKKEPDGIDLLKSKLEIARELIVDGALPFNINEFDNDVSAWMSDGFPAVSHSDLFRDTYLPSYRVISNRFVPFLPLLAELDKRLKQGSVTLAIEGGSASGKSTLGAMLQQIYRCTLFHMDDFFLQPHQRTPDRFAEIGGNVDRERFLEEVLIPHSKGEDVAYRRFNCSTLELEEPVMCTQNILTVTEGAYSMHPDLADYYDFSVFLDISPEYQRKRILKRNSPEFARRFFNEWIPMEIRYFTETEVRDRCTMVIPIY